jgi:hypothetical protein
MIESKRLPMLSAIAAAGLFAAQVSAGPMCAHAHEQTALNTSVLRAELMVAALSCGRHTHYNAFVTKFNGDLTEQGYLLRAFFQRQYGNAAEQYLNRFVTRLANDESKRSIAGRTQFCTAASALFQQLLEDKQEQLQTLASSPSLSTRHGIPSCEETPGVNRGGDHATAANAATVQRNPDELLQ